MFSSFFRLAAVAPGRQRAFRILVLTHLALLAGALFVVTAGTRPLPNLLPVLGHTALIAGIVEGALLLGWRLTQVPKSQALEFLLVSPMRPARVFLAEAAVGLARLALVTLSGLPLLLLLVGPGFLDWQCLTLLLLVPFTWGAITGLGLTVWAYEPVLVRRVGEVIMLLVLLFYLVVGVLAGEHLRTWLQQLPAPLESWFLASFLSFHHYNPFALLATWLTGSPYVTWETTLTLTGAALAAVVMLALRAAGRLHGHFEDRHYRPAVDRSGRRRPPVGERPLAWWAVKRVSEYAGRINLWLAGAFGLLYAAYTVAGPNWPGWLGRQVFLICESVGGIPAVAAGLVVLAAVPAAFQYGLWDSSAQDRCRRLELLLLTDLTGRDYWEAAVAAAWRRGRGYFAVAVVLWGAAVAAGQIAWWQALGALAAGVLLWGLYFALGFRAFARGVQANGLGLLLTLGLPLLAFALDRAGWPAAAAAVPPGSVYRAGSALVGLTWLLGLLLAGAVTLGLGWRLRSVCERQLRTWYDRHHGQKVMS